MADRWKIEKWTDETTPRRAIHDFVLNESPVESPDVDELFQPDLLPNQSSNWTPVAGHSGSQRNVAMKRKLTQKEDGAENTSKKSHLEVTDPYQEESGLSEVPSQLGSPSMNVPARPIKKKDKRMSMTAFTQALSQEPQESLQEAHSGLIDESSGIPSALESPEQVLSQRPGKSKNRTSMSAFKETLQKGKPAKIDIGESSTSGGSSRLDNSDIPSNLQSPDFITSQRPLTVKDRKRISSTGYQQILNQSLGPKEVESSLDQDALAEVSKIPESQEIPEAPRNKSGIEESLRKSLPEPELQRMSDSRSSRSIPFKTSIHVEEEEEEIVLEKAQTDDILPATQMVEETLLPPVLSADEDVDLEQYLSLSDAEDENADIVEFSMHEEPHTPEMEVVNVDQTLQRSSTAKKQPPSTSVNAANSSFSDSDSPSSVPDVRSMRNFSPIASSTQLIQKESTVGASAKNQKDESVGGTDISSSFDVPSKLDTPEVAKKTISRPGPTSSKKRMSMSGFTAVLGQKAVASSVPIEVPGKPESSISDTSKRASSKSSSRTLPELDPMSSKPNIGQTLQRSSTAKKQLPSTSADAANSSIGDSGAPSSVPDLESTQLIQKESAVGGPAQDESIRDLQKNKSVGGADVSSSFDVPSKLDTPEVSSKPSTRQGPISTKKRMSMSGFTAVLGQKATAASSVPTVVQEISESSISAKRDSTKSSASRSTPDKADTTNTSTKSLKQGSSKSSSRISSSRSAAASSIPSSEKTTESSSRSSRSVAVSPTPSVKGDTTSRMSSSRSGAIRLETDDGDQSQNSGSKSDLASSSSVPSPRRSAAVSKASLSKISLSGNNDPPSAEISSSSGNRSRKSLKFDAPSEKEMTNSVSTPIEENLPQFDDMEDVEETPSDVEPAPEAVEDEEDDDREVAVKSVSNRTGTSPTNRYPALKNSTVVAGGEPFLGGPLAMSPIRLNDADTPPTVQPTPSTPAPFRSRKQTRSVPQSPMFMNVMQKAIDKTSREHSEQVTPRVSRVETSAAAKSLSAPKGKSLLNPSKGKSLVLPSLDEQAESSDNDWEDVVEEKKKRNTLVDLIMEAAHDKDIPDRRREVLKVPLEERLKADKLFQAKVKIGKAKMAAQKAAEEALAAQKKAVRKPRTVKERQEDNVATVVINKANYKFYSRSKVSKEALDSVHDLVGEWLDHTLDQMENFCSDEGKLSLDTWEDCYKMMKRQGLVKDYWDYSGLCHDLLSVDEYRDLLPSSFPAEHYEAKREAKRQRRNQPL